MNSRPDDSIIVVTHQGRDLVLKVLRAARASNGPIDVDWTVVDSGSSDGTSEAIERQFPDVTVVRLPNVGFAAANNVAIRSARGRYLLLLNPDPEIVFGTLAQIVAAMDERPQVGISSATTHYPDGRLQPSIRRFPSPARQLGEAFLLHRLPARARATEQEERPEVYETERSAD